MAGAQGSRQKRWQLEEETRSPHFHRQIQGREGGLTLWILNPTPAVPCNPLKIEPPTGDQGDKCQRLKGTFVIQSTSDYDEQKGPHHMQVPWS